MIPLSNSADNLKAVSGSRLLSRPREGHLPQEVRPDAGLQAPGRLLRE